MPVKNKIRKKRMILEYRFTGCPLTKSNSCWCHQLCVPVNGNGKCGRIAPHALIGKTQEAIRKYRERDP